jgi:hypothetical protein
MMHAKFSCLNPLTYPTTNSNVISKILTGSTSILINELLKFGYSVGHCGADGSTCVSIILNGCPTGPEPSMPFKHPCMDHAFFPEHISNHSQGLHCTFLGFAQALLDTHCPLLGSIVKSHQARYITPNKGM